MAKNIKFNSAVVDFGDTVSIGIIDCSVRVLVSPVNKTLNFKFKTKDGYYTSIGWVTTEEPIGTVTQLYYDGSVVYNGIELFKSLTIQPTDLNEFMAIYKDNTDLFSIEEKQEGIRLGETLITEDKINSFSGLEEIGSIQVSDLPLTTVYDSISDWFVMAREAKFVRVDGFDGHRFYPIWETGEQAARPSDITFCAHLLNISGNTQLEINKDGIGTIPMGGGYFLTFYR